jgi:hypothetical protein
VNAATIEKFHSAKRTNERTAAESGLLLYPKNAVLSRLGDSEFEDGLGWDLDFLLGLGIEASTCFPLLLYELPKSRHDEFAVLFGIFVGDGTERIKEYAGGLFIGLRGCGKCALKFCLGHLIVVYGSGIAPFQENRSSQL